MEKGDNREKYWAIDCIANIKGKDAYGILLKSLYEEEYLGIKAYEIRWFNLD